MTPANWVKALIIIKLQLLQTITNLEIQFRQTKIQTCVCDSCTEKLASLYKILRKYKHFLYLHNTLRKLA